MKSNLTLCLVQFLVIFFSTPEYFCRGIAHNVKMNYSKLIYDFLRSKQHRQLLNCKKAILEIQTFD